MDSINKKPVISLCMPTNGVIEWVFPALDSIYSQKVDISLFEVIVTNNGDNDEFDVMMKDYSQKHPNLIYSKNNSYMFFNQLEALKLASGEYLKFVNHRNLFVEGSLMKMIDFIRDYLDDRPVFFFSNGMLNDKEYKEPVELNTFDSFVGHLKRLVSWTTGVGIWREDYESLGENIQIDSISPHSCILFSKREKSKYIINNFCFAKDIVEGHENKGKYDLFKAFSVEEPTIVLKLYIEKSVTSKTLKTVLKDYRGFVSYLYYIFCIKKEKCSYDLTGFDEAMGIFFTKKSVLFHAYLLMIKMFIKRLMFWRNLTINKSSEN